MCLLKSDKSWESASVVVSLRCERDALARCSRSSGCFELLLPQKSPTDSNEACVNWKLDFWIPWIPTCVGIVAVICQLYLKRYATALACAGGTLFLAGLAYWHTNKTEVEDPSSYAKGVDPGQARFEQTLEKQETSPARDNPLLSKSEALEMAARRCSDSCPNNGMSDATCAKYCGCIQGQLSGLKDVLYTAELLRFEDVAAERCADVASP